MFDPMLTADPLWTLYFFFDEKWCLRGSYHLTLTKFHKTSIGEPKSYKDKDLFYFFDETKNHRLFVLTSDSAEDVDCSFLRTVLHRITTLALCCCCLFSRDNYEIKVRPFKRNKKRHPTTAQKAISTRTEPDMWSTTKVGRVSATERWKEVWEENQSPRGLGWAAEVTRCTAS